jgi:hypothetical protein
MRTFLANLKHDIRNGQSVEIGSGIFSPAECLQVVETIRIAQETLAQLAFAVETVAHLRGMEVELLPVADKARELLARMERD